MQHTVLHNGLISVWKSQKSFVDANKGLSVDTFFVYSQHDASKVQISVH